MKAILYAFLAAVFYAINIPTLVRHHTHPHQHTFTHFHGGYVHTHTITHTHEHDHFGADGIHSHRHPSAVLERELGKT
ncbi:MAG: hypothetical protein IJ146_01935 [Kiritimatiellae bacterium]|nr:hypothetical protein [Kiritimatiellia bacterium]